ncbi:hypothetical protein [Pedococcus sp. 2YAF34]|uniref:hypothetical protein n=1 Tax=Pedococcus sp. 2YAF34 TaxID=3233032 RepID=UPI003F9940F0
MGRAPATAVALACVVALAAGCASGDELPRFAATSPGNDSGGTATTAAATPSTSASSSSSLLSPSPSTPAAPAYRVGGTLTGTEFAAQLLERTEGATVRLETTTADSAVTCVAEVGGSDFLVTNPVKGVAELRVVRNTAYVQDRPGSAQSWLEVDLSSDQTDMPSQAVADALNLVDDVWSGDCRAIDRYAAIDAAGKVRVKAVGRKGWTVSAPTDPESQGSKFSDSKRTAIPGTWELDLDGRPVSYTASDRSRTVRYSHWDDYEIAAPPASQVRR